MGRFELEGIVYYQQTRKCGKKSCRCANGGPLHGPYWYTRDILSGRVEYLGKELPPVIVAVKKAHEFMLPMMTVRLRKLKAQADALEWLRRNAHLTANDKVRLIAMGFGDALVCEPGAPATQENNVDNLV